MIPGNCSVLIVGGGPCGLMLANELGRRHIDVVLVDEKPTTAFNPQANATQARTMEHFRRLGIAEEIRALGLPPEYPTDIAYFTRFAGHELARFQLPSSNEAKAKIRGLGGSWSAAELPHRVSQKFVESVLRRHAERLPKVSINYGVRLEAFSDCGSHVEAQLRRLEDGQVFKLSSQYLVGADGPRSSIREQLGFQYVGEAGMVRDFMGGPMYAVYLRSADFYRVTGHAPAWMNVSFNRERRAFMAAVDGKGEFAFHTQLKSGEPSTGLTDRNALEFFRAAVGLPIEAEILSHGPWTAGHALVANHFQAGRVILGGDAVHLFTPAGGLGYNTAIEDAVNLGWKLAAKLKDCAGPQLLKSYEEERRPVAIRNTTYARRFADSLGLYQPPAEIEEETERGETARRQAGEYFQVHAQTEFNIPGVSFGGRYDGSPIIVSENAAPPADAANTYIPTALPGGRPPHLWLDDGRSLYDTFGFNRTLLRMGRRMAAAEPLERAALAAGFDLSVVDIASDEARDIYGADLALIRPDQIVAWRGNDLDSEKAKRVIRTVAGFHELAAMASLDAGHD